MDTVLKFTSQNQGKDRVFRATQFACALSSYLLRSNSDKKDLVAKLKSLEASLNAGRKVFRLGNAVNSIEAAKRSMRLSDPVLSLCLAAANLNRALYRAVQSTGAPSEKAKRTALLYFICDNVLWAANAGLIRGLDKKSWSAGASRFYLLSLIVGLARDVYVVLRLMAQRARDKDFRREMTRHLSESPEVAEVVVPHLDAVLFLLLSSLRAHPAVALDTLKNLCDLFIPLDKLGIYPSSAGTVALCGLVSSLIGIITYTKPGLSIKP